MFIHIYFEDIKVFFKVIFSLREQKKTATETLKILGKTSLYIDEKLSH